MMEISHLSVTYPNGVKAVTDANLMLSPGEIVALVGESGSGKSSLLYASLALLPRGSKTSGEVFLDGMNFLSLPHDRKRQFRWKKVSLVLQGSMNSFTPVLAMKRQFVEVMQEHLNMKEADAAARAGELLEEVGLDREFLRRFPHEMSGGQKQRCAIAMALCCNPDYLLADEPTTALDVITQAEIIDLLKRIVKARNMGMLMVTHDLALAASIANKISVMHRSRIVETAERDRIINDPKHPHTASLIRSLRTMEEEH